MKHVGKRADPKDIVSQEQLDPWAMSPVGSLVALWDHLAGVSAPPTDRAYRWVKLTASDSYNAGVLTNESVSGSAPLVQATAKVNLAASPINGLTISLINTERRVLRAGSSGTAQDDALQGHKHRTALGNASGSDAWAQDGVETSQTSTVIGAATGSYYRLLTGVAGFSDGTNGTPRTASETRAKNIGATYYLRIL